MKGDIQMSEFQKAVALLTKPIPMRPMVNIELERYNKLLQDKTVDFEALEYFDGDATNDLIEWTMRLVKLEKEYGKPALIYTDEDSGLYARWILAREATEEELREAEEYIATHQPEPEYTGAIRFKRLKPFQTQETN